VVGSTRRGCGGGALLMRALWGFYHPLNKFEDNDDDDDDE
jgi:hypothetical protein